MNKVAAFALRRKNSILSMSEKRFCPPQPLRFWITPAYAGKSYAPAFSFPILEDHPRVCGEKWRIRWKNTQTTGSPPRMRGKAMPRLFLFPFWRITPAYAGKRIAELQTPAVSWDHPRVCGEKVPITCVPKYALGSPPRMRGKACLKRPSGPGLRITPAYAGKSMCG